MLKVSHLRKTFGPIQAVNDISFEVEQGEVLGFLGPNGAGKTTTMRMLTGFLPPTSGTATLAGYDINFLCLDLTNTAAVRTLETEDAIYLFICQAEDREWDRISHVFAAMTTSFVAALTG